MRTGSQEAKISCRAVWKIYGSDPIRVRETITPDESRAEVLKRSNHLIAVRDVSFDIGEGETFVVMGLSGSGKSTLVRCISRLVRPTAGAILVDGENIAPMSDKQLLNLRRHKMSMVFQHFGLFPHRCVIDNVAYGLEIQGVTRASRMRKAGEVLDLVGLTGWERHYPHQLSGGMKQRVGLARALAVDPEILLFDEPFSALDPLIRREMQNELLRIQKVVRKTMVFITHDSLEAMRVGSRIAIMNDGGVVQVGTLEDIVTNPANDHVRSFIEDVPRSKVLTAGSIMTTGNLVVADSDDAGAVLARMDGTSSETAFVNGADGQFLGTVSRKDIERAAKLGNATADSMKDDRARTVVPETVLDKLIGVTARSDGAVAVVDPSSRLVGSIDRKSVMLALAERG